LTPQPGQRALQPIEREIKLLNKSSIRRRRFSSTSANCSVRKLSTSPSSNSNSLKKRLNFSGSSILASISIRFDD